MLLVVDPQIDFITGSLPVPGAADAMDNLAKYVREHGDDYLVKIATSDWHPYRHCSFTRKGGEWPAHCVQHSTGAAVWQSLLEALNESRGGFTMLYKGDRVEQDEYSIMQNQNSASVIIRLVTSLDINQIDVCGLAGDICVLNTSKDLIELFGAPMIRILTRYAPSLDDGSKLKAFIEAHGLNTGN